MEKYNPDDTVLSNNELDDSQLLSVHDNSAMMGRSLSDCSDVRPRMNGQRRQSRRESKHYSRRPSITSAGRMRHGSQVSNGMERKLSVLDDNASSEGKNS